MEPDIKIIDNGDGTFSKQTIATETFDPVATQTEIDSLTAQMAAAIDLAARNVQAQFQPQIDALQAILQTAVKQVPAIETALASIATPEPVQAQSEVIKQ